MPPHRAGFLAWSATRPLLCVKQFIHRTMTLTTLAAVAAVRGKRRAKTFIRLEISAIE